MAWPGWEKFVPPSAARASHAPAAAGNKYHAQKVTLDNFSFDSKREARRYQQLKSREHAGQIADLELQPRYLLTTVSSDGHTAVIGEYVADFRYLDLMLATRVVEDVKSPATRTALFCWKKKHVEAEYGLTIVEV